MDGVLVIDKPVGPTSFAVVQKLRLALGVDRAGHTGTLDPLASGVLPVCLGEATKVAGFIARGDKSYQARLKLGVETDTLDVEGKVTRTSPVPDLARASIEATLKGFLGARLQVPPMYSAVRVGGRRLYDIARRGDTVERQPRPVTLYSLELEGFENEEMSISMRCSKGFYVRALVDEIGRAFRCGAHLKTLRRTASAGFTLEKAVSLDPLLGPLGRALAEKHLISMAQALSDLPAVQLNASDAARVRNGARMRINAEPGCVRLISGDGALVAVAEVSASQPVRYLRVFREARP